jgi:hypothetical protein
MALRNGQGQRKKYLTLQLSSIKNLIENMWAIVSEFQSAKIGDDRFLDHHLFTTDPTAGERFLWRGPKGEVDALSGVGLMHVLSPTSLFCSPRVRHTPPPILEAKSSRAPSRGDKVDTATAPAHCFDGSVGAR